MSSSKLSSNPNFNLPEDLIIAILSRLPVKSLVRFAVVCKAWYELVKDPDFISEHLRQSKLNPDLDMDSMLVISPEWGTEKSIMWSYKIDDSPNNMPIKLNFPFLDETEYHRIVGVCHGLFCICLSVDEFNIIICNPATMKFQRVPNCRIWENGCIENGEVLVGFVYDPRTEDYELIKMMYDLGNVVHQAEIYTMSTNSWRDVEIPIPFLAEVYILSSIPAATIGSVFYWEGQKDPLYDVVILSFDTTDKVFRVIEGPACYSGEWEDLNWIFIQLKEEIAIIIYQEDRCFDVWVPNENESCWINKFKIGPLPTIGTHPIANRSDYVVVHGCGKSGNFIIEDNTRYGVRLVSCDSRSQEIKILPFDPLRDSYAAYFYTDSLLPVRKMLEV